MHVLGRLYEPMLASLAQFTVSWLHKLIHLSVMDGPGKDWPEFLSNIALITMSETVVRSIFGTSFDAHKCMKSDHLQHGDVKLKKYARLGV